MCNILCAIYANFFWPKFKKKSGPLNGAETTFLTYAKNFAFNGAEITGRDKTKKLKPKNIKEFWLISKNERRQINPVCLRGPGQALKFVRHKGTRCLVADFCQGGSKVFLAGNFISLLIFFLGTKRKWYDRDGGDPCTLRTFFKYVFEIS